MTTQKHFIFARSAKGNDSVETHPTRLQARYRRFLELVDGRRTVAELNTVARPNEIPATLKYLLEHGFIEKVGEGPPTLESAPEEDAFSEVALTSDMFVEFQDRAVKQLTARFGDAALPATKRLSAATTPAELREALRDSEGLIASGPNGAPDPAEVRKIFMRIGRNFV